MRRSSGSVLGALALVLFTGCAAATRMGKPESGPWPPAGGPDRKPTMSVLVGYHVNQNHAAVDFPGTGPVLIWRQETIQAYRDSRMFQSVVSGPADTDFRAEVEICSDPGGNVLSQVLCGITLGVFPGFSKVTYTVHTLILNRDGVAIVDNTYARSLGMCIGWIALPVAPFMPPVFFMRDIVAGGTRAVLREARAANRL